mmetsp:Transcript_13537/g.32302  ORF Transcript_13537/g.32302 Transcript_13537/m.32302 type:complete len:251 (+) Transcript_13537:643-1395(+)
MSQRRCILAGLALPRSCAARENHADGLWDIPLLDRPHLQASDLVDAEDDAVLSDLVELRGGGRQNVLQETLLEGVVHLQLLETKLRRGRLCFTLKFHLEAWRPGTWEIQTWVGNRESLVAETQLAALPKRLLLTHHCADLGDVLMIGVRRDESVAFFRPVALRHLVDIQQQALVLRLHPGKRLLLQALQESLSEKCTCFQRIRAAAARREAAGKAVLRSQRELVQVQVHTLRHLGPLPELEALRHEHRAS